MDGMLASTKMRTVLLVEEERALRALMVIYLKREGCTVIAAQSAQEAIESWPGHAGQIELLIADVRMRDMGGLRLAEILTALKPGLKVIFCSGGHNEAVEQMVASHAGYRFLAKPFSPKQLRKILVQVFDE